MAAIGWLIGLLIRNKGEDNNNKKREKEMFEIGGKKLSSYGGRPKTHVRILHRSGGDASAAAVNISMQGTVAAGFSGRSWSHFVVHALIAVEAQLE